MNGCDPLNFTGCSTPGLRVPALPQNRVVYVDGVPQGEAALKTA